MRILLLLFSLLFSAQICFGATSLPVGGTVADSVIFIEPIPAVNPWPGPRMPAFIPISASYEATLSTLFLTFTSNLGEIEVTTSSCSPSRQVNGTRANSTSRFLSLLFPYY